MTNSQRLRGELLTALSLLLVVASIVLWMIWRTYPFIDRALAFEDSPIAWLQSALLVASATMCLALANHHANRSRGLWVVLALLLLLAALDERFQIHENVKRWMLSRLFSGSTANMGPLGDMPMLLYPTAGFTFVAWCGKQFPRARLWWLGGVAVGCMAVAMDIVTDKIGPQMIEEVLEAVAETLFLCGLVIAQRSGWSEHSQ